MKPSFRISPARKFVLSAVALVCAASTASAAVDDHEAFLEAARSYSGALSLNPAPFFSSAHSAGALTLDSVYSFDFATAGMGTVIFRAGNRRIVTLPDRDAPRAVGSGISEAHTSFDGSKFFDAYTYRGNEDLSFTDVSGSPFDPLTPAPEPSTWFGAALALAIVGFTQRRRLRGLIANRA